MILRLALIAALIAGPAYAQVSGYQPASPTAPTTVTVNQPPNDVTTGPTACTTTTCLNALTVNTSGSGSMGVQITGTGSGMSFTFEGSVDSSNFFAVSCYATGSTTANAVTTGTANGSWYCPMAGYKVGKVVWATLTSGTATQTLNASAGSAQPPSTTTIAGKNGSNQTSIAVDVNGNVLTFGAGSSVSSKQVANNTTSVAIDANPGTLYGVTVFNNSATIAYLKIYNASQGSTTCGSGTPVQRVMIPANTSGAGAVVSFPNGVTYSTAITACTTTGFGDSDTTAPAATTYMEEFYYR